MEDGNFAPRMSGLQRPDRNVCAHCKRTAAEHESFKRCQKCRTVAYCGRECQVADWKVAHRYLCDTYFQDNALSSASTNFGVEGRKGKHARTREERMAALYPWANEHNGDTFTLAAWQALRLHDSLDKSKTHFLAITVRKNAASRNLRASFSFVDGDVLPLQLLVDNFASAANAVTGEKMDSVVLLQRDREQRLREGGLGSVLVMTFELDAKEKKTPEEAAKEKSLFLIQPLGLFKVHQANARVLGLLAHMWKQCVKNSLDGGAYSMQFHEYDP